MENQSHHENRDQNPANDKNITIPFYIYGPFYIIGFAVILTMLVFEKEWVYLAHPSEHFQISNNLPSISTTDAEKNTLPMVPETYEPGSKPYDIEVCNTSSVEKLYVSLAYFNPVSKSWIARGWFVSQRGECLIPLKNVKPPVYAYAESINGNVRWGDSLDANTHARFCIDRSNKYTYPRGRCEVNQQIDTAQSLKASKTDWQSFKKLNVSGHGGVFTWELAEP